MSSDESVESRQLLVEYRQKRFCDSLVEKFLEFAEEPRALGAASQNEATNIIHRWVLSLQQSCQRQIDEQLPLFPPELELDSPLVRQLAEDALDKGFCVLKRSARNLSARIVGEIERFRRRVATDAADEAEEKRLAPRLVMLEDKRGQIAVGDFTSSPSYRLPYLAETFGLRPTARMLLRYEALGSGSYQWGDPLSVHLTYYNQFGARYEGFSSPLNSRFLGLDGSAFCSLFADTDAAFGSLGNFFGVDLKQHQGGWSVNPPFIESVLLLAAEKVLASLRVGCRSWYFVNFPDWRDSAGWRLLDASPFKVNRFDFSPGEFLIQDAYGRPTRPKMRLSIFVLGHLPDGSPDTSRVADAVFKARPPTVPRGAEAPDFRRIF